MEISKRRLVCVCLLLTLLLGLAGNFVSFDLAPTVKAESPVLLDSYSEENQTYEYHVDSVFGSEMDMLQAEGSCFTVPSDQNYNITSAKFYVRKIGSPVGHVVAKLYAITGTYGVNGKPTGDPLATSNLIDMANLPDTLTLVEFTFPSGEQYEMTAGEHHCIAFINNDGTTVNSNNCPKFATDNEVPLEHDGNSFNYHLTDWYPFQSTYENIFYVYGEGTGAPPYYTTISTNTTRAGRPCLFRVLWWDDVGLSGFIFGTNNTGSWQNDTWINTNWESNPIAGYADAEKTLNETEEILVQWQVWANDTSNQWANTGIQAFNTTGPNRFVDPSLAYPLTGTVNFTEGSQTVTGEGTNFTGELPSGNYKSYIRPIGCTPNNPKKHPDWFTVMSIINDTELMLQEHFWGFPTFSGSAEFNGNLEGLSPELAVPRIDEIVNQLEAGDTLYLRRNQTYCHTTQDNYLFIEVHGEEDDPITLMGDDGTGWAGETGLPKPSFPRPQSRLQDTKYWIFKDVEFIYGREALGPISIISSNHTTFEDVDFYDCQHAGYAVGIHYSENVTFTRCTFHDNKDDVYSGQDVKIYGPSTVYFEDCVFNTGEVQYPWGIIIFSQPSTLYIRDTTFGVTTSYKTYDIWSNTGAEQSIAYVYNVTFTTGTSNIDIRDWFEVPPDYSNVGTNTTLAGNPARFHVFWQHEDGLSGYIYGTNNTGTWQNDTWTDSWSGEPIEGWSNVTKTLNSTVGVTVEFQFWCNNTNDIWGTTETKFLTTTSGEISIEVDQISVSTLRINVAIELDIYFHSRYNNNQSSVTTGTLYVNTTECSINSTGWASLSVSSNVVTKKICTVTGVNVNGETDYQQIPPNPQIIWDRIEVESCGMAPSWVTISSTVTLWWKLRYDYDDVTLDVAKGSVDIGGAYASWNASAERWQRSVTLPSTPQTYPQAMTFSDSTYDLTAVTGTTTQNVIVSIFTTQALHDYNTNQQNSELPYISTGTNHITALSYSDYTLNFTVDAPSETTSTTKVYCGDKGMPKDVTGAEYDYGLDGILTLIVTHSSSQEVTVEWSAGGSPYEHDEEEAIIPPIPPPLPPPEDTIQILGYVFLKKYVIVAVVLAIVALAVIMVFTKPRKSLREMWNKTW